MFIKATPVWACYETHKDKLNRHLIFKESIDTLKGVTLSIAAADFYRLTVNGKFVGFGPARTAKGYGRVDIYDLSSVEENGIGSNEIVIEVAGFFCKSLSTVRQDSYLCAELIKNGEAIKYTGRDFEVFTNARRVREVERYSVQRHFGEVRDERIENPYSDEYKITVAPAARDIRFIPRHVPFASCKVTDVSRYHSRGVYGEGDENLANATNGYGSGRKKNAYSFPPDREPDYGMFEESEITYKPFRYVGSAEQTKTADCGDMPVRLCAGEWLIVDFRYIQTGFLRFSADAHEESDVIIAFNEMCEHDTFTFRRINLQGVVEYIIPKGEGFSAEAFEPYTFRFAAVFVKRGAVTLNSVGYRTFERDTSTAIKREFKNPALNDIYNAALRTFAHNAVDLFMDCPSRERAGWLCDSFFTGRAEYFLYGDSPIEDAFLENFVLYENEGEYPEGVLPMCYPADHHNGNKFIPQWDMWYVLEVCEYLTARRPDADREFYRPSVMGVLDFLAKYENADGLLENLPSWNFIEWSDANDWTKDVNYPTSFLYAGLLDAVADAFDKQELHAKADKVRAKAIELSFNGEVFVDHGVRNENGVLVNQTHVSEACQYYAILYAGVDLDEPKYAKLKQYVIDNFESFDKREYQFCPINAFIGLYLRMNVLMNMGDCALLAKNVEGFCIDMARTTGTLWEYKDGKGSLDHGFASYVALTIPFADSLSE